MNIKLFDLDIPVSLLQGGHLVYLESVIHAEWVKKIEQFGISRTLKPVIPGENFITYSRDAKRAGPVIQYFLGDEIRLDPIVEICAEEEVRVEPVIQLYPDNLSGEYAGADEKIRVA